jgi:hypothetical protein
MASKMSRLARSACFVAVAAAATGTTSGQGVFDPYQPESAPYYSYMVPSLPTNLALPNAAREAGAYQALGNAPATVSRYNSFGRFLEDYESGGSSRGSTAGMSYLEAAKTRGRGASSLPPAEQRLREREAERAELELERSALYRKMVREPDPTRKAQIYREIQALSSRRISSATTKQSQIPSRRTAESAVPPRSTASRETNVPAYGVPPLLARPDAIDTTPVAPRSDARRPPAASGRPAQTDLPPIDEPAPRSRRPPSPAEAPATGQPRSRLEAPASTTTTPGSEPSPPPLPLPDVPPPR